MPDDLDMMNEFGISQELSNALRGEKPSGGDAGAGTEQEPAPGAEQTPVPGTEGGVGGGGQTAVETEPVNQPDPGATPGSEDPVARLSQQLEQQNQQIANLTRQLNERAAPPSGSPQQQPPAAPGARRPVAERVPNYDLRVPASIVEGIASQDASQRAAAVQQLSQGIARTVHAQVLGQMDALEDAVPQRAAAVFRQLDYYRSIFQDFYGNFPKLNDRTFYPIVEQVGNEYFQQNPQQQQWDARARSEIAKRVYARLGWPWQQQQAAPAARTVPGASTRPGGPALNSVEQDVLELLT